MIGKLEAIIRKGGIRSLEERPKPIMIPLPKPQTKYLS